ncbi:hypothetical protein [Nakamurella sp. PAMC28650]|uniref:hypothetical protein n=1 Tax=Nakamurella sp. PAMC28650 TaxID=2762325 RepID=UPI00164D7AC4|nr:hypothetical protein [Nakamurella sp. PAMC28650]QNK82603.1 hypothetical protein H7F38_07815 [Nakamurella sp. PAMC28650]
MSWPQTVVTSGFFTIGTSSIGGPDIIKSGGAAVAFFDKYQYWDYSPRLINVSVSQKIGQYPYGTIMAQLSAQLDNGDYLFTPGFDATIGAYTELPGRPVKFSLGFEGETLQQFVGFTDKPTHDRNDLTISLTAFDAFAYIATYKSVTNTVLTGQRADQIIATALAEMGFSASQYSLDLSLMNPIGALAPYGLRWGDIFHQLCEAEQALMFVDENGIIQFWNRQHFINNQTTVWNLDYTNMENLQTEVTPIFNDVLVVANPRAVGPKQKVWEQSTPVVLSPGLTTVPVDFTDANGSLPVTTLDTPIGSFSSTTSTYTANAAADGSGTDRTGSVTVSSVTLNGTSAVVVFNNATSSSVYLTTLLLFGTSAPVTAHISVEYKDAASISLYGVNPGNNGDVLEIDNNYIQDQGTATSLAFGIVNEFKDARGRYLAYPLANPAIQIGDYLQVTNSDSGVVKNMWVTGRTISLGVGDLSQVLELEERALISYFKIGTSSIGGTAQLAP